jgi:hypothetical protein
LPRSDHDNISQYTYIRGKKMKKETILKRIREKCLLEMKKEVILNEYYDPLRDIDTTTDMEEYRRSIEYRNILLSQSQ